MTNRLCGLIAALGMAAVLTAGATAANEQVIRVWDGVAPGSEAWRWSEDSNISQRDKSLNYRNIVTPTLTVYPATKPNGTGVLIIPGGGFINLGYGKEGEEIAHWYNSLGVTAFVLKYRLARTGDDDAKDPAKLNARIEAVIPLAEADAKEAVKRIKARKGEWGLSKIGVQGFSAGGLMTWNTAVDADPAVRPDFIAPFYCWAPDDLKVSADVPPAFIVMGHNDRFSTSGVLALYRAWHSAGRPAELHIYTIGEHGFAMRKTGHPVDGWPDRLKEWLTDMGFLPPVP